MGILDDAIREHLDLKRRLGAEDEEIDKLESEAFGPPSRPDDPDFAEPPAAEPAPSAAADEVVAPPAAEPPIESFDTVEHHFEGAIEETGEAEVVEGELEDEAAQPQQGTAEEDVLEETPEFLRDQPEDDELWFEQGEPKDFDF